MAAGLTGRAALAALEGQSFGIWHRNLGAWEHRSMSIFGSRTPSPPANPPAPKSTEALAEDNAATAERLRLQRAQGKQSTILGGAFDQGAAPVYRKTLLGG